MTLYEDAYFNLKKMSSKKVYRAENCTNIRVIQGIKTIITIKISLSPNI